MTTKPLIDKIKEAEGIVETRFNLHKILCDIYKESPNIEENVEYLRNKTMSELFQTILKTLTEARLFIEQASPPTPSASGDLRKPLHPTPEASGDLADGELEKRYKDSMHTLETILAVMHNRKRDETNSFTWEVKELIEVFHAHARRLEGENARLNKIIDEETDYIAPPKESEPK